MNAGERFPELWDRVQAHEPQAVELIVSVLKRRVRQRAAKLMCKLRIPAFYDAEDTSQWVLGHFLVRAHLKQIHLESFTHLVKYVLAMTNNRVVDLARRHRAESDFQKEHPAPEPLAMEAIPGDQDEPAQIVSRREMLKRVREEFSRAEWNLVLSRLSGQTWEELAVIEETTPDAVRMRFTRKLESVKKVLAESSAR